MSKSHYKLAPPHGDRIYWQSTQRIDSRVEEISANREWFWQHQQATGEEK